MKNKIVKWVWLVTMGVVSGVLASEPPQVSTGSIERVDAFESKYIPARTVDVWLPPSYDPSNSYAVLYMHDGQMLFDAATTWNGQEWRVDEVAGELIAADKVRPFIVVGVFNGGVNRHSEYFPQKPFESLSGSQQAQQYELQRSETQPLFAAEVYSDRYLKFLVEELKPYIQQNYPVKSEESYLLGSSMGGLISMYGLLEYPTEFKGAACLSTHWPGSFEVNGNPIPQAFNDYIDSKLETLTYQKIYFDFGTETLDALYPPLQAKVDEVFIARDFPKAQWTSKRFEGAAHTEEAWAARLHIPLEFLFATAPN